MEMLGRVRQAGLREMLAGGGWSRGEGGGGAGSGDGHGGKVPAPVEGARGERCLRRGDQILPMSDRRVPLVSVPSCSLEQRGTKESHLLPVRLIGSVD